MVLYIFKLISSRILYRCNRPGRRASAGKQELIAVSAERHRLSVIVTNKDEEVLAVPVFADWSVCSEHLG